MDEGNLTKALYIGVSLFVTVIIISGIMAYYSASRNAVKNISGGIDFDVVYRDDIKETLLKSGKNNQITGTQVKNIVNYYYDNKLVQITISGMKYIDVDGLVKEYDNISLTSLDDSIRTRNYETIMKNIINNQYFTLETNTDNDGNIVINIKGE